jgi:hypothetical protein
LSWLEWGGDGFWLIWILGGTKEPVEEAWFWLFVLGISLPEGGFGIILAKVRSSSRQKRESDHRAKDVSSWGVIGASLHHWVSSHDLRNTKMVRVTHRAVW